METRAGADQGSSVTWEEALGAPPGQAVAHPRREPRGPWLGSLPPPSPPPHLRLEPCVACRPPLCLAPTCPVVWASAPMYGPGRGQTTHSCGRGERALNAVPPREHEATCMKCCRPGGAGLPGLLAPQTAHVTSSLLALPPPGSWMPPSPHSLRPRGHAASSPLGSPHPPAPPLQPVTLVPHVPRVLLPFLTPSRVWLLPCPPSLPPSAHA